MQKNQTRRREDRSIATIANLALSLLPFGTETTSGTAWLIACLDEVEALEVSEHRPQVSSHDQAERGIDLLVLMGVDFGEKRIGLAIAEGEVAVPLVTLVRKTDRISVAEIAGLAKERQVAEFIVGDPLGLDGRSSSASERVRRFGAKLAKRSGLNVTYTDESLTSQDAETRLAEAGVDTKRRRGAIDAMAAAILLQQEIDHRRGTEGATA